MKTVPFVNRVTIYPVKSLDGVELQKAMVTEGGCLQHDREFAIIDTNGKFVNGKSNILTHSLRSTYDFENETISLKHNYDSVWNTFHLQNERVEINSYLTKFFSMPCELFQDKGGRFLDIPDQSGATVLSTESLKTVSGGFGNINLEETRRRFRATIELANVPAFWEDKLFLEEGTAIEFKIGKVILYGMSPRARCIVPTRNPVTGDVIHAFPKSFAKMRKNELPDWSTLNEYDHYYYLSTDCHIPDTEIGKWIHTGDELKITGRKDFRLEY